LLGKLKTFLKVCLFGVVVLMVLFGIYRREYLAQAIPVYMQYLEQRSKWEKVNTGTYAFFYGNECLRPAYYFVENNTLKSIFRTGLPVKLKYLMQGKEVLKYISHGSFCTGFKDPKKILVEKRFDEILWILWYKLWDNTPFKKVDLQYPIEIGYDYKYGYPKGMIIHGGGHIGCIRIGEGEPYFKFTISELKMFNSNHAISSEAIKKVLKNSKYIPYHHNQYNDKYEQIDIVGGSIIESHLIKKLD